MFNRVTEPYWVDRPLIIVGGGPSLRGYDCSDLRDRGRVVLLNDAVMFCEGDVLFSMDANWIKRSTGMINDFTGEEVWLTVSDRQIHEVYARPVSHLKKMSSRVNTLSTSTDQIYCGGNAGFGVLNLALLKGARVIYLLGYDMNRGPHEQWHTSEALLDLPKRKSYQSYYARWGQRIGEVSSLFREKGIRIINCNPASAVTCFEFSSYEEFGLKQLVETSVD